MSSAEQRWTDRLHLRRVTLDDTEALVGIETDPAGNAYRPGGPPSAEEAEQHVRDYVAQWSADGVGYWAVEHHGTVVGVAGLRFMVFQLRDCWNLYYRFAPRTWGRGYATEAATEAVAMAIEHVPRLPVVARTRADNPAALRVAEAAGLERRPDLDGDGFVVFVSHW